MIAKKMRLSMAVTAMAASVLMTTPAAAAEKKMKLLRRNRKALMRTRQLPTFVPILH